MKTIKRFMLYSKYLVAAVLVSAVFTQCHKSSGGGGTNPPVNPPAAKNDVDFWLTKADETLKMQKINTVLAFGSQFNLYPTIEVDESTTYQTIDGFGFTLTGGSAEAINSLNAAKKQELLQELFGSSTNSIGISFLRISIGASDLNAAPFTYDDLPVGQTDINLDHFSLAPDMTNLIPLLKEIIAINPRIKILATPWSAPVWMK